MLELRHRTKFALLIESILDYEDVGSMIRVLVSDCFDLNLANQLLFVSVVGSDQVEVSEAFSFLINQAEDRYIFLNYPGNLVKLGELARSDIKFYCPLNKSERGTHILVRTFKKG